MIAETISQEVLVTGAKEIFETMIFLDLKPMDGQSKDLGGNTLLGSITFTGDIEGCLGMCCHQDCAEAVSASMLAMDSAEELTSQDIHDAIGEVCNMLMGCIKTAISDQFGNIQVSIPTVIRGQEIEHNMGDHAETLVAQVRIADQYHAELSLQWRFTKKAA